MNLMLLSIPSDSLALLITGVFALFAMMLIPIYFVSIRPVRGTTEWISRIDRPKFTTLTVQPLRWGDLAWALLAGFCGAMLRLVSFLLLYLQKNMLQVFSTVLKHLSIHYLLPCALLSVAIYLLLRSMCKLTLPAVCCALLAGLMQISNVWAAALVAISLLFLWLWTASNADTAFFPRALLLLVSLAVYGLALLRYWELFWLCPIFPTAYIYAQIYRWRKTTLKNRGVRLAISLLLIFFAGIAAVFAGWAYYCLYKMQQPELLTDLRLLLQIIPSKLLARLKSLSIAVDPFATVLVRDALLFSLGAFSLIPLLHGIFRWHDSKCIAMLVLLPLFAAVWFCGGMYLCVPMLSVLLGWVLAVITEREHPWIVVGFSFVAAATFILQLFI